MRLISPFSAGGGTDTVARALSQLLGESLGRIFVVDNRAGAEGTIGTEIGARAPADGYTLLLANLGTLTIAPNLRKVPYDSIRDFAPITLTTESSAILVVHPSLPVKTLQDFIALARARSGQINYGASSAATMLPMEMLKQMAGMDLTHIPYKGTGPALAAMLGGEVQAMFGGAINTTLHVRSGRLRALAVAGSRRASGLPDVPTVAESGYPGYDADSWNGVLAPAGTPRALVMRLNEDIHTAEGGDAVPPGLPKLKAEGGRMVIGKGRPLVEQNVGFTKSRRGGLVFFRVVLGGESGRGGHAAAHGWFLMPASLMILA